MKRSTLVLLVFAVALGAFAAPGVAGASHCKGNTTSSDPDDSRRATTHDPFGSCEDGIGSGGTYGNVRCGANSPSGGVTRQDIPNVGTLLVKNHASGAGVQACQDNSANVTPAQGRVTVYRSANGNVMIASDGDDSAGGATPASWSRVDIRPAGTGTTDEGGCTQRTTMVHVRRGAGGAYWDKEYNSSRTQSWSDGTKGGATNVCVQPPIP